MCRLRTSNYLHEYKILSKMMNYQLLDMTFKSITSHRGTWVILGLCIIIATGVLIGILKNTSKLNNDKLIGKYSGTITIPNESIIDINITFNGQGGCSGTVQNASLILSFDDGDYVCQGTAVQITIFFDDVTYWFVFIGELEGEVSLIRGQIRKYESSEIYSDGNFVLSKV